MRFIHRTFLFLLPVVLILAVLPINALQETFGSELPGRIAYVGDDFNIHVFDVGTESTFSLTEDGGPNVRYQWPTWSNDGRLAYFCCDLQFATSSVTSAYISPDGILPGRLVFGGIGESIIYAYWAPASCDDANCRELAMLVNNIQSGSLSLLMVRDTVDDYDNYVAAMGSPFYYSWSPDATQMAFHRNNRLLSIYSGAAGDIDVSLNQPTSGAFQAPAWSPIDNRILLGVVGVHPRFTNLVTVQNGEITTLVEDLEGGVSFAWSPDGQYIAYRLLDGNGYGSLIVINAMTGEPVSETEINAVVAFFWSPDSSRIAFVTPPISGQDSAQRGPAAPQTVQYSPDGFQPVQQGIELSWNVLDVQSGVTTSFGSFLPTPGDVYMILYFDQFAQSHSIWSPDSKYIVYSELMLEDNTTSLVQIRDVLDVTASPVTIGQGGFAVWSYDE